MKKLLNITIILAAAIMVGCADFPEKYDNVIEGQKIRPFAIVLDPPEAAPGDTVHVILKMYDADKEYNVDWELGLEYQIDNYDALPVVNYVLNMEEENMLINQSENGLEFSFVVPTGNQNPLLLSSILPQVILQEEDVDGDVKSQLGNIGVDVNGGDISREDLVEAFENNQSLPNELSPLVDNMVALVQLRAKVRSPGFSLDVTKNLSIRYSNRLESGDFISNVNENPVIDSIAIIRVYHKDITDPKEIKNYDSDTLYFKTYGEDLEGDLVYDTLEVGEKQSFFAMATSNNSQQSYRSPNEKVHKEDLFYSWFYTNLDDVESDWDDLLNFNTEDSPGDLPIVAIKLPKNKKMEHFVIRCTSQDWRVEWSALTSRGLDHKLVYGFFKYE